MSVERPSIPEPSPVSPKPRKRTLLGEVFKRLPAGSREVAKALAFGAMEMLGNNAGPEQQVRDLADAQQLIQEQREDDLKRDLETREEVARAEAIETIEELRRRIKKG